METRPEGVDAGRLASRPFNHQDSEDTVTSKQLERVIARAQRNNELRKKYEAKALDARIKARQEVTGICEELIGPLPSEDGPRIINHLAELFDVTVMHGG